MVFTGIGLIHLTWLTLGWSKEAPLTETLPWIPAAGLNLDFWLDGPALFYTWLVYGIGFLVIQYAGHYMKPDDSPWRFYSVMLVFLSAMLGLVLARDFLLMFIFWEVTSLTSFLLIGHWHHLPEARKGARRALLITGMGGLSLMAGIAFLAVVMIQVTGEFSLRMDDVWAAREAISEHPLITTALVLMLIGALTKSAQFPFHFWLPGAMKAPTPVSALLHAATMVKAGIYLLGRMYPAFGDEILWLIIAGGAGVMSMLVGGYLAIVSTDIKALLAYSTVSQLGLLTSYYGFGFGRLESDHLLKLDLLLVASHALFKAGLFMLCGVIDHGTHTRDWKRLGGLRRKMPVTAALTIAGCISMAGLPFSLGFVAKKIFLEASAQLESAPFILGEALLAGSLAASVLTVGYCFIVAIKPFFGKPREQDLYDHAHGGSFGFLFAPGLLIGLCILGGLYVPALEKPIAALTNTEFYAYKSYFTIAWFPKIDWLFWASLIMYVILGPLILVWQDFFDAIYQKSGQAKPFLGFSDRFFDVWVANFAAMIGAAAKPAHHQTTLAILFGVMLILCGAAIATAPFPAISLPQPSLDIAVAAMLIAMAAAGVVMAVIKRRVYTRIISVGLSGLAVGAIFVVYKAPDLALTQLLVELAVLLMFLGMAARLKTIWQEEAAAIPRNKFAAGAAVALGLLAAGVTFIAASSEPSVTWSSRPSPEAYYLTNAFYPETPGAHSGGGNNAVNVTLVDFRALDTFGEVIVLVVAALGVFSVLMLRMRGRVEEPTITIDRADAKLFLLKILGGVVSILCAVYAVVLFLAGHQMPGGGFIAGLLAAIVVLPFLVTFRPLRDFYPHVLMGWGILAAAGIGIQPALSGEEFLKSAFGTFTIPIYGELKLSTALVFDIGVFLIVLAVTLSLMKLFATRTYKDAEEEEREESAA